MTKQIRQADPPLLQESDDQGVKLLLSVASGRVPRLLALQPEFEPLVQLALDAPDELYKQEYFRRSREIAHEGGLTIKIGSEVGRGRSRLRPYLDFRDIHALLSYAVLLLLNDQRPYGKALSRCFRCQDFYLAQRNPRGGPANHKFCGKTCRTEYQDSAERKAANKAARKHK